MRNKLKPHLIALSMLGFAGVCGYFTWRASRIVSKWARSDTQYSQHQEMEDYILAKHIEAERRRIAHLEGQARTN
ncbi:hypothetical protein WR25_25136 [Diploscapter pachys]|uniref:Uncharacterized protein n=1 Tax=Diploscapter pachys TaxID=2018661 RepID=A0A2A2LVL7_9BILA|nr:hypothetical protein WR25_25136 [Diploscapter pachys]